MFDRRDAINCWYAEDRKSGQIKINMLMFVYDFSFAKKKKRMYDPTMNALNVMRQQSTATISRVIVYSISRSKQN